MVQGVIDIASKVIYKKEFSQNVPDILLKEHFNQEINEIVSSSGFWIYITSPCELILDKH